MQPPDHRDYEHALSTHERTWLVTGSAGFIGSHLVERLLQLNQRVVGIDDLSSGSMRNLQSVEAAVGFAAWRRFRFIQADIRSAEDIDHACQGVDYLLHHAAIVSVTRSMQDPLETHKVNETGFWNVMLAAANNRIQRVVFASSSAVYGESGVDRNSEETPPRPQSPYALSKLHNEWTARLFAQTHGVSSVGLRYFNVFGSRQDPASLYAGVIPRWISQIIDGHQPVIFGDGSATRNFCHVSDVVDANLRAAMLTTERHSVFNVASDAVVTTRELFDLIAEILKELGHIGSDVRPAFAPERPGEIRFSAAALDRIRADLGYAPTTNLRRDLRALAAEALSAQYSAATSAVRLGVE
jgi:UDP-N-acetylglucosamine 4-epimerase